MTARTVRLMIRLAIGALGAGSVATRAAGAQVPGELRGRVTDAQTSQPVANARVDIVGRTEHAQSELDGSFVLRGLEPRAYTVRVRAVGYTPQSAEVDIANGRAAILDVALQPNVTRLGTVVVRAAADTTAAGAVTFDQRAIDASGRRDVGELLQSVPGVVVTQRGGPGSASTISIRGSQASDVLVLVDGTPINSVLTGEADLSRISLGTIERVTVIPGAQSARYGGRALAGVVLIETRRADNDLSLTVGAGAWGERNAGLSAGATRPLGTRSVGGTLAADYRTIRGDFPYAVPIERGGGTAERANAGTTSGSVVASASLENERDLVRLRGEWEETSRGLAGSIEQPSLTGHERDSRLSGGADARLTRGWFTWAANADFTHEHERFVDPDPPFGAPYDDGVDADALTVRTTATAAASFGTAILGAEARTLDVRSAALAPGAPGTQHLYGIWAALRASRSLGAGLLLTGDAAARLDWDSLLRGTTTSPRGGLSLSRGRWSLSASVGQAYTAPSLSDQFFHEGVLVRPNPNLQPERVRDDVEARAAVQDVPIGPLALSADVARYRADVDGMILWLPDFQFVWSPSNFDVRRSGWDASARLALPAAGVDVRGTVSSADVTYTGSVLSGQVTYQPRTTASIAAGWTHAGARLDVTTLYVGQRRTVAGSALNTLAPYWLTNAMLTVPLSRAPWATDATLGIDNTFDRAAAMLVDYPFPGRTWTVGLRLHRGGNAATAPNEP